MRVRSLLVVLLLGFQGVVLVGMAAAEELGLRAGTEVTLQTVPVDPRDLLRGDYVTLAYEISTPNSTARFEVGDRVWVHLVESGDRWVAQGVARERPDRWDAAIRGTVADRSPLRVSYGIEAYFVPEGRGHEVERAADVDAVVSVDNAGRARLRYLIVDGARWDG